jgi:hypothetical protein
MKTEDASDLLKHRKIGYANAEAQLVRINGGTPSGPDPYYNLTMHSTILLKQQTEPLWKTNIYLGHG